MRAHRLARPALGLTLALLLLLSLPGCAAGAGAQRLVLLAQDDEGFYWENLLSGARLAAQDAGWEIEVRLLDGESDLASQLPAAGEADLAAVALSGAQGEAALRSEVPLVALGCEIEGASGGIAGEETTIGRRTGQLIAQKIGLQRRFLLLTSAESYAQDDWEVALRARQPGEPRRRAPDRGQRGSGLCLLPGTARAGFAHRRHRVPDAGGDPRRAARGARPRPADANRRRGL